MQPTTIIEFPDVPGSPKAEMSLPPTLRVGDQLKLDFTLSRTNPSGRYEILEVTGSFRVSKASVDASKGKIRSTLQVESTGKSPAWRAVKKPPSGVRKLAPAISPPTPIES